jgi:TrpR-related protein YerC/YecD
MAADRAWIIAASKEPGWPQNSPRAAAYRAQKAEPKPRDSRARRDPYVDWQLGAEHDVGAEWRDETTRELLDAIVALPDREAAERFFRDLCTLRELYDMAQRWRVVQLLDAGWHYLEISRETGASTATVTRISQWLRHGTGGYREALERGQGLDASVSQHEDPSE